MFFYMKCRESYKRSERFATTAVFGELNLYFDKNCKITNACWADMAALFLRNTEYLLKIKSIKHLL